MNIPTLPLPLQGMRFRGNRDYLQGADILPIALHALANDRSLEEMRDIDVVFHALARTGLTLCEHVPQDSEPKAQLSCKIDGVRRKFLLVEDGRPITERQLYPEEQIVAATAINVPEKTASSSAVLQFTNIERWIAMIKALHQAVYPHAQGKWLFARAKLATYTETQSGTVNHGVCIESNFGEKLTRSRLTIDGRRIGDIYFALT